MDEFQKNAFKKRKESTREELEKWGKFWYQKLRKFHDAGDAWDWHFTEAEVIAFLRHLLAQETPAWKRLKVVENLCWYRDQILKVNEPKLDFVKRKLKELNRFASAIETNEEYCEVTIAPEDIEGIVGIIDPNEPAPLQGIRRKIRLEHKALSTEEAYVGWVKRFMQEHRLRSIASFDKIRSHDIEAFLTRLAVDDSLAAGSQDQAFYAIRYLYEHVLERDIGKIRALRSKKPKRLPVVMSREETSCVLSALGGRDLLIAQLLYGCGMRLKEVLRLRVKDIDFDQHQIVIRQGKGGKDRIAPLPVAVVVKLNSLLVSRSVLRLPRIF